MCRLRFPTVALLFLIVPIAILARLTNALHLNVLILQYLAVANWTPNVPMLICAPMTYVSRMCVNIMQQIAMMATPAHLIPAIPLSVAHMTRMMAVPAMMATPALKMILVQAASVPELLLFAMTGMIAPWMNASVEFAPTHHLPPLPVVVQHLLIAQTEIFAQLTNV